MFYIDIFNQVSLIIVLCFSFFIFMYNLCLNNNSSKLNLLGNAFFSPFLLSAASFISLRETMARFLLEYADLTLIIIFLLILRARLNIENKGIFRLAILAFPVSLLLLIFVYRDLPGYLVKPYVSVPLFLAAALLNMYFLRKEKGAKSLIFWSMLCMAAESVTMTFEDNALMPYLSVSLKFTAYFLLFAYFHKEVYSQIMSKVKEADEKLLAFNKRLDLEVKKRVFEIERSNQKLVNISKTDALTQAYNKAAILDIINRLIESKSTREFSILMFDIDNFKVINDTAGHVVGDKCIKKLALIAKNCIREVDSLGRYGGDEFIIVLPDATIAQAKLIAERFIKKVEETESPHFTVSIGIANYPNDARTVKDLIAAADEGLYQSKRKGRNTVSHRNLF